MLQWFSTKNWPLIGHEVSDNCRHNHLLYHVGNVNSPKWSSDLTSMFTTKCPPQISWEDSTHCLHNDLLYCLHKLDRKMTQVTFGPHLHIILQWFSSKCRPLIVCEHSAHYLCKYSLYWPIILTLSGRNHTHERYKLYTLSSRISVQRFQPDKDKSGGGRYSEPWFTLSGARF